MSRLILLNKPFDVLSQFTDKGTQGGPRDTLSKYVKIPDVYPAGRLDRDSEGLLLLTDDGRLQAHISDPKFKVEKTYLAQVEGEVSQEALRALSRGVTLKDGLTLPAKARRADAPGWLWPRVPPVRYRAAIPTSWIELTITEGRNRQVRRMTAAVGFATLRLIRLRIGDWSIEGIESGDWRAVDVPAFGAPKPAKRGRKPVWTPDTDDGRRPSGKPSPHGARPPRDKDAAAGTARNSAPKSSPKSGPQSKPKRAAGNRPPLPNSPKGRKS
ncbi:Ribosomal large subunit pseudouridine synthase E [Aquimixticola soesokkakensis]|uniref:Pseudouridine synthase n=1 Tax=Aquimixticola soesokkakensis TaxID=1519096 RepID=A0A1Y5SF77_9RHOB|nr:pseudouridine synthase [Aquimixticola soesokkakensis]SLN39416.1 Ribosomal large subunit pseudouridine synthase E [Aquimixticola soesokkakensis]